jgi:hypothetical protein
MITNMKIALAAAFLLGAGSLACQNPQPPCGTSVPAHQRASRRFRKRRV